MRPLRAGKRCMQNDGSGRGRASGLRLHLHALVEKQVDAGPSMNPLTPVTPVEGSGTDGHWMQQDTHLARLFGRTALPLTLPAQRTGAATANAGCIHHTQASIGFSTSFMRDQFLSSRATERAIRLERKVGSGEAPRFPGSGSGRWTVSRGRSR
jgi:hypothetical protein